MAHKPDPPKAIPTNQLQKAALLRILRCWLGSSRAKADVALAASQWVVRLGF